MREFLANLPATPHGFVCLTSRLVRYLILGHVFLCVVIGAVRSRW